MGPLKVVGKRDGLIIAENELYTLRVSECAGQTPPCVVSVRRKGHHLPEYPNISYATSVHRGLLQMEGIYATEAGIKAAKECLDVGLEMVEEIRRFLKSDDAKF